MTNTPATSPTESHQTHRKGATRALNVECEYFCKSCKKWYKLSEYSVKDFMCKKCLKIQNEKKYEVDKK